MLHWQCYWSCLSFWQCVSFSHAAIQEDFPDIFPPNKGSFDIPLNSSPFASSLLPRELNRATKTSSIQRAQDHCLQPHHLKAPASLCWPFNALLDITYFLWGCQWFIAQEGCNPHRFCLSIFYKLPLVISSVKSPTAISFVFTASCCHSSDNYCGISTVLGQTFDFNQWLY